MRYVRDVKVPPEIIKTAVEKKCLCNVSYFRLIQMSAHMQKNYGLYGIVHGTTLFFILYVRKTVGFNAPHRHLRLKMSRKDNGTHIKGGLCLSDVLFYLILGVLFSGLYGIKSNFDSPLLHIAFVFACIGVWFVQSLLELSFFGKMKSS